MVAAGAPSQRSYDSEDELDTDLAAELSRFQTPEAWRSMASHLDLVWKISRVRRSTQSHPCDMVMWPLSACGAAALNGLHG